MDLLVLKVGYAPGFKNCAFVLRAAFEGDLVLHRCEGLGVTAISPSYGSENSEDSTAASPGGKLIAKRKGHLDSSIRLLK